MPFSPAARRLVLYANGLLALLVGAELVVRLNERAFAAAAHRARFKAELLARHGPVDFVAIGTSRLNDGVSPAEVARAAPRAGRGFNASIPSSAVATTELLAGR